MEETLAKIDNLESEYKKVTDALFDKFSKSMGVPPHLLKQQPEKTNKVVVNGVELNRKQRAPICNCGPLAKAHLRKDTCPQE